MSTPTGKRPDFETWMRLVDEAVYARLGCSVHDLPDCLFADWYAAGVSPKEAARRAIRNANDEDDYDE